MDFKVDRLQRAMDYQQNGGTAPSGDSGNTSGGGDQYNSSEGTEPPARPAPAANSAASEGLAPGPTTLGTIPANAPMPLPKPANGGAATVDTTTGPAGQHVASLPPSTGNASGDYDAAMALLRKTELEVPLQFDNFRD